LLRCPRSAALCPYTTLFRSLAADDLDGAGRPPCAVYFGGKAVVRLSWLVGPELGHSHSPHATETYTSGTCTPDDESHLCQLCQMCQNEWQDGTPPTGGLLGVTEESAPGPPSRCALCGPPRPPRPPRHRPHHLSGRARNPNGGGG